jgi:peptidoglycan/xylan/chitin deacetylase (PgdA/CDA1 family)
MAFRQQCSFVGLFVASAITMSVAVPLQVDAALEVAVADETTTTITTTTTTTIPKVLTSKDVKVTYKVNTKDKVVFITIDDGFHVTPALARVIRRHKVPITTFAMPRLVAREKKWYLANKNMTFENHTVNHRSLTQLSFKQQQKEICRANTQLEKTTKQQPSLFRPPGGNFNQLTKKAIAACGMKHLVMWNVIAEKGVLRMPRGRLTQGDIILMHYIPSAAPTLELLLRQIKKNGLKPALLRDYLK